jgi:hypothetical protein
MLSASSSLPCLQMAPYHLGWALKTEIHTGSRCHGRTEGGRNRIEPPSVVLTDIFTCHAQLVLLLATGISVLVLATET